MNCQNCKAEMRRVNVAIEGATTDVTSFQCEKCDFVEFEQESANQAILQVKVNKFH